MGLKGINVNGMNYAMDYNYLENKPNGRLVPEFDTGGDDQKVLAVNNCNCEWCELGDLMGGVPTPGGGDYGSVLTADHNGYTWQSVFDALGGAGLGSDAVLMVTGSTAHLEWVSIDSLLPDSGSGLPDIPEDTSDDLVLTVSTSSSHNRWTSVSEAVVGVLSGLEVTDYVNPDYANMSTILGFDGMNAYMVEPNSGWEILCASNGAIHWQDGYESIASAVSLDSVVQDAIDYPSRNNSFVVYDTSCVPSWTTISELIGWPNIPAASTGGLVLYATDDVRWVSIGTALTKDLAISDGDVLTYDGGDIVWQPLGFGAVSAALGADSEGSGKVLITDNSEVAWGSIEEILTREIPDYSVGGAGGGRRILVYDSSGIYWDDPD